jgi:tRNA uridine 5-carbamoylmethylation protein Kti12
MEKEGISYQESFASNILQAQFEIVENLKAAVSGGSNIILDQLNLTPAVRRKKLLRIPPEIYTRIAVSFVEDSEVLVERNRERLKNGMGMPEEVLKIYINTYVPPSVKEGFDEIWSPGEIRL